jgi:hypothetical protein
MEYDCVSEFLPARLQRKISGKGEPLPDGDSGK